MNIIEVFDITNPRYNEQIFLVICTVCEWLPSKGPIMNKPLNESSPSHQQEQEVLYQESKYKTWCHIAWVGGQVSAS